MPLSIAPSIIITIIVVLSAATPSNALSPFWASELENATIGFLSLFTRADTWAYESAVADAPPSAAIRDAVPELWHALLNPVLLERQGNASVGEASFWLSQSALPFSKCSASGQSPISLRATDVATSDPNLPSSVAYQAGFDSSAEWSRLLLNRSKNALLTSSGASSFILYHPASGDPLYLHSVMLKSPSEHIIAGAAAALEVQLLFSSSFAAASAAVASLGSGSVGEQQALTVAFNATTLAVSVFFDSATLAEPNLHVDDVLRVLRKSNSSTFADGQRPTLAVSELLPAAGQRFALYRGTSTAPPCADGVDWILPLAKRRMSDAQLLEVRAALGLSDASVNVSFYVKGTDAVKRVSWFERQGNARPAFPVTPGHQLRISWPSSATTPPRRLLNGTASRVLWQWSWTETVVDGVGGAAVVWAVASAVCAVAWLLHRYLVHRFSVE